MKNFTIYANWQERVHVGKCMKDNLEKASLLIKNAIDLLTGTSEESPLPSLPPVEESVESFNKMMDEKPTNYGSQLAFNLGKVTLLDHMGCSLDIVNAARVSLNKMSQEWGEKDIKLLKFLVLNSHTSPLEMVEFKFEVVCPLFVARQWMRHRTWSYNEVSRRYTDKDVTLYYIPTYWRKQSKINKQCSIDEFVTPIYEEGKSLKDTYFACLDRYYNLLDQGVCREQARMVLPQCMMTKFIAKVDGNNLMKFVILRSDEGAQEEIRWFAKKIVAITEPLIKDVWDTLREMGIKV